MTTAELDRVEDSVEMINADDARKLTEEIKTSGDRLWELITQAYLNRAWQSLGYEDWDAYCASEFGESRLQLPREKRQEKVQSLRSAGLTIQAIASVTGAGTSTVSRDAGDVEPPPVADGKKRAGRPKGAKNKATVAKEKAAAKGKKDTNGAAPQQDSAGGTDIPDTLSSEYISVPILPDADPAEFKETENVVAAFGSPEVGAVAIPGAVISYRGKYELDTMRPEQARVLATALLQAADRAEA